MARLFAVAKVTGRNLQVYEWRNVLMNDDTVLSLHVGVEHDHVCVFVRVGKGQRSRSPQKPCGP